MGEESVKSVFLTRTDIEEIVEKATQFASEEDWFVEQTENKSTFPKMAEMVREFSKFFEQEAEKHQQKVINVDVQFEERLGEALDYLSS